jgi:hypothetical protein
MEKKMMKLWLGVYAIFVCCGLLVINSLAGILCVVSAQYIYQQGGFGWILCLLALVMPTCGILFTFFCTKMMFGEIKAF